MSGILTPYAFQYRAQMIVDKLGQLSTWVYLQMPSPIAIVCKDLFVKLFWGQLVSVNSLRPRQNGRLFADDTFKRIFLNENIRISTKNSLKFVPKGLINNIPALVLIMAWRRTGDKPLSEPMLVRSLTHICVTRPQWVNTLRLRQNGCHLADNTFKCIFWNENVWISIKISLKFVPSGPFYNMPALVQIMACCRLGDKPLSEPVMVCLLICVTRPQWVNPSEPRLLRKSLLKFMLDNKDFQTWLLIGWLHALCQQALSLCNSVIEYAGYDSLSSTRPCTVINPILLTYSSTRKDFNYLCYINVEKW